MSRAVFEGFWLGSLDQDGFYVVDEWFYANASEYAAADHNRRGLFTFEQATVDEHLALGRRVLVSAAGGGREVIALLEQGYDAYGFECNRTLVEVADRLLDVNGHRGRVEWVPRGAWPTTPERFDLVMLGWGSYSLAPTGAERITMLREAAARVVPGGSILLSFLATDRFSRADRVTAYIANALRRGRRRPRVELGDRMGPNFVHFFSRDQIEHEVRGAGLQLLSYSSQGYGHAVAKVPADQ